MYEPVPVLKLTRTRWEDAGIVTGRQPMQRNVIHSLVQARAAFVSEN